VSTCRIWSRNDGGASVVGLLLALVILGAMAAIAVSALDTTVAGVDHPGSPAVTTPTIVASGAASAALRAVCVADFEALSAALRVYEVTHGAPPAPGTSWALAGTGGARLLATWPSDPGHFRFTWNGATLGVVPRRGTRSVASAGDPHVASGCDAALG
jgi:hypothetical protein